MCLQGVIIVFDTTNKASFDAIPELRDKVRELNLTITSIVVYTDVADVNHICRTCFALLVRSQFSNHSFISASLQITRDIPILLVANKSNAPIRAVSNSTYSTNKRTQYVHDQVTVPQSKAMAHKYKLPIVGCSAQLVGKLCWIIQLPF